MALGKAVAAEALKLAERLFGEFLRVTTFARLSIWKVPSVSARRIIA